MDDLVAELAGALGEANLLVSAEEKAPFLCDWLGKYRGAARAVIRPGSTAEVAAAMRICARHNAPVVAQGGNTSMSGGATPPVSRSSWPRACGPASASSRAISPRRFRRRLRRRADRDNRSTRKRQAC